MEHVTPKSQGGVSTVAFIVITPTSSHDFLNIVEVLKCQVLSMSRIDTIFGRPFVNSFGHTSLPRNGFTNYDLYYY